ncbi:MAG TPA: DUF5602 domain-containing protein [Thermoanaerobaculia bacterium]|nr:DUF5602 domain-containing protein [Thermoanaerobaculia bacterium]
MKPAAMKTTAKPTAMRTTLALTVLGLVANLGTAAAQSHAMHQHSAPPRAAASTPTVADTTAAAAPVAPAVAAAARAASKALPKTGIVLGEPVAFGNGTARTLAVIDLDGKPITLGVSLSATALEGLPPGTPADDLGWLYRLPLPAGVALPPFDHVGLYWNPLGHEPRGIYDVGHFDVHFFLTTPEQADVITAVDRDLEKVYRLPPASAIPAGYFLPPGTQHRRMGVHWIDGGTHELHGESFTATYIIGSYDGQVNFLEPMIARSFLLTRPDLTKPLAQPAAFARAGWYPTEWSVRWDEGRGEYLVLLDGLRWQDASLPAATTVATVPSADAPAASGTH